MSNLRPISIYEVEIVLTKTMVNAFPTTTILLDNVKNSPLDPNVTNEYLTLSIDYGISTKLATDPTNRRNLYQRTGEILVSVYTPLGEGVGRSMTLVTNIVKALQDNVYATQSISIRDSVVEKLGAYGGYYRVDVSAEFYFIETP